MLLRVTHETRYAYSPPVETAQHLAHLRPIDCASQRLLSHTLTIDPAPAQRSESPDVYGNLRAFFALDSTHGELAVTADSVVETTAAQPSPAADHALPWEAVRERFRYAKGALFDPASEFVFPSTYVPRHEDFSAYARPSFEPGRPLFDAAMDLTLRMHRDFAYDAESTEISTPAIDALAQRKGVCQDFAHIMIACLRTLGLPARYVSGYLLTQPPPGAPRLVGADASHAWVSVYLPGAEGPGDWSGFDPTNGRQPGEDYVMLAVGRDYADVSPMRGVLHGGARHTLGVRVTVQPLEPPSPPTLPQQDKEPPMSVYDKLTSLGITLPPVSTPAAAYVPFVQTGNLVFLSGHIARKDGKPWVGQFGAGLETAEGKQAARAIAIDLLGTLHAAVGDLNKVKRIVKLMSLVNSSPSFTEQHLVTNGASELMAEVFGDKGAHARSAFGVAQIPMGACVEIELIAEIG